MINQYTNDPIIQELLICQGDSACILNKLTKLNLKSLEFTLAEVGMILGITRERVRQIEDTAMKKLKHPQVVNHYYGIHNYRRYNEIHEILIKRKVLKKGLIFNT
jgi:hypothetical protein